jgi:hypothetical protein
MYENKVCVYTINITSSKNNIKGAFSLKVLDEPQETFWGTNCISFNFRIKITVW